MGQDTRGNAGSRKQIAFDLSQKALAAHYPRPKMTINPKFYQKAYSDIRRFMKKNGFEHRQFSVYISKERMTNADITLLMINLATEMPWLSRCANQIDVTNIGAQHSLLQTLETAALALTVSLRLPQQTEKTDLNLFPADRQEERSITERMIAAKAEAGKRNHSHAFGRSQHSKNRDIEK